MTQEPGFGEVNPAIGEASRQVLEHLGLIGEEWFGLITLVQLTEAAGAKEATLPGQRPWDYAYGAACEIIYAGCQDQGQPAYPLAYQWLRRYFFNLFKNQYKIEEIDAEDLAGDAVEIVLKRLSQVRFPTAFLAWATQISRNVFKDYLSKKERQKTLALPQTDPTQAQDKVQGFLKVTEAEIADLSPGANPETAAIDRELRERILDSIQKMRSNTRNSQLYKRIIIGFYLEDKSIEELANLLGLTSVQVTKLKSQALLNLRKIWQNDKD